MDMTRLLKPYLNVSQLEALGGAYDGVIAAVSSQLLRNKFRAEMSEEAVVSFLDGTRLVLNKTMLRQCIEWFGAESEHWIGRRVSVFLRRVESVDRATGELKCRKHRGIACTDAHATNSVRRSMSATREPGEDDEAFEAAGGSLNYRRSTT